MKRRVTILTRERFERVTFGGRPAPPARAWCEGCCAEAEVVTPEEAARLTAGSVRAVCRAVEAGLVHFAETPDGGLLVCLASLSERSAAPAVILPPAGEP